MALSFEKTGKYTSERHQKAKDNGKLTAGEAAKKLSKALAIKVSSKEIVEAYKLLKGTEPEWHHSGFYKGGKGKTMGRTFFFTDDQVNELASIWAKVDERKSEMEAEEKRKQETTITGFYFIWDYDYSGRNGKKRNYKVLKAYNGPEATKPSNFKACNVEQYKKAKAIEGKKYFGWDEPQLSDFN